MHCTSSYDCVAAISCRSTIWDLSFGLILYVPRRRPNVFEVKSLAKSEPKDEMLGEWKHKSKFGKKFAHICDSGESKEVGLSTYSFLAFSAKKNHSLPCQFHPGVWA